MFESDWIVTGQGKFPPNKSFQRLRKEGKTTACFQRPWSVSAQNYHFGMCRHSVSANYRTEVKLIAIGWQSDFLTTPWRHTHKFPISLRDWFYDHIQSGSKSKCNRVSQPPRRLWHSITLGLWPRCLRTSKLSSSHHSISHETACTMCSHSEALFKNACGCNTMDTNTKT